MYHIRTMGMCTSKAAIKMCTYRGGRVNVNPNIHRNTHMPQAAKQLGQVDILVVNGECLRRAYMRNHSPLQGSPRYHHQYGETTTAKQYGETTTAKEGHQW